MRITAHHCDGFTKDLLKWTLTTTSTSDVAHVVARWFGCPDDGSAEFDLPFDPTSFLEQLPTIETFDEFYSVDWTDCGTVTLEIESDGKYRSWSFCGCEGILENYPELEPFFVFWRPLDRAIEAKLALPGRRTKKILHNGPPGKLRQFVRVSFGR